MLPITSNVHAVEASSIAFSLLCQICCDRATGKHYGAKSCDGCKGFFRRTVRKNLPYACRYSGHCVIDKDKRNTCRSCRYEKCLKAGMRQQAVQSERDRITARRSRTSGAAVVLLAGSDTKSSGSPSSPIELEPQRTPHQLLSCVSPPDNQLEALEQAEHLFGPSTTAAATAAAAAHDASSPAATPTAFLSGAAAAAAATASTDDVVVQPATPTSGAVAGGGDCSPRLATVEDLADAIREQLLLLVEWAKALPAFVELSLDDQVSLLRAYAAEHLLLGVARRSLPFKDVLLLSNDACIPREHASEIHDVNHVVFRILDELVEPMRELQLDDTENGCLKALLFFNPNAQGLCNKAKVKETRQGFLEAFHEYVTKRRSQCDKVRFGNLLLLLPPLQAMSQQFIVDLQLASLFGKLEFDKLLEELLLATASPPFIANGYSAVAKKMSDVHHAPGGIDATVTRDHPQHQQGLHHYNINRTP